MKSTTKVIIAVLAVVALFAAAIACITKKEKIDWDEFFNEDDDFRDGDEEGYCGCNDDDFEDENN